jgi:hypothetical protein
VTDRRTSPGPVAADDHVSQMGVRAAFSQSRPIRTPPGAVVGFSTRVSTAWRLVSGPDRCATQTGSERLHRHRCLSVRMHRRDICSTASIEQLPRVLVSLAGEARAGAGAYPDPANRRADDHESSSRESAETHCRFGLDPAACDDRPGGPRSVWAPRRVRGGGIPLTAWDEFLVPSCAEPSSVPKSRARERAKPTHTILASMRLRSRTSSRSPRLWARRAGSGRSSGSRRGGDSWTNLSALFRVDVCGGPGSRWRGLGEVGRLGSSEWLRDGLGGARRPGGMDSPWALSDRPA